MSQQINPYEAQIRVVANPQLAEYGKFVQLTDNTRFPAVSVTRLTYPDRSAAFPANSAAQPLSSVDVYPKYGVISYVGNESVPVNFSDSPSIDAFGRLRISQPITLHDGKHLYNKMPYIFDEQVGGTATSTFVQNDSLVLMQTTANNDYVVRQSRVHFNYQPGKSMQGIFSGLFAPEANVIKRVGLCQALTAAPYDINEGLYLEVKSTGPAFCIKKGVGTGAGTTTVPQSAWNVDKLDGTGPSGVTIDFTKAQIFTIDYEWLGIGRIRFGFYQSGTCYYAHYINNINNLTAPYITSPNQPVHYEIRQTGAGSGSMSHICSTVIIEGAESTLGTPVGLSNGSVDSSLTETRALLFARVNPLYYNRTNVFTDFTVLNSGNYPVVGELYYNPIIGGTQPTWIDVPNTTLQYANGSSTTTLSSVSLSGTIIKKTLIPAGQGQAATSTAGEIQGINARLGTQINGTPDIIALGVRGIGSNASSGVFGAMNFISRS